VSKSFDPAKTQQKRPSHLGGPFVYFYLEESLVVSRRRLKCLKLGVYDLAHFPDPFQVGVDVAFALLVEDSLTIEEYFHDALAAGGDCDGRVFAIVPEKFIRHPRGDSVVLSTYAVGYLYLELAFHNCRLLRVFLNLTMLSLAHNFAKSTQSRRERRVFGESARHGLAETPLQAGDHLLPDAADDAIRVGTDGQDEKVIHACVLDGAHLLQTFVRGTGHGEAVGQEVS